MANANCEPVRGTRGKLFAAGMLSVLALFVAFVLALVIADACYVHGPGTAGGAGAERPGIWAEILASREIRAALLLTLQTSILSTIISLLFAVPTGYALSRYRFPGRTLADTIVDLPIIFPPLVMGLSLLVFFRTSPGMWIEQHGIEFTYQPAGIVLCQFAVSASFGIRAIKATFDETDPRLENVALTLGCTPAQAFFRVALPMARNGIVSGAILTWARAFGIFGPLIVFVGAVRMKTEVLPTSIYLEQSIGRIEVALALALVMIVVATAALLGVRALRRKGAT